MYAPEALVHAVARQLLLGLRESLTIAGQVGSPVEVVNEAVRKLATTPLGWQELHRYTSAAHPAGRSPRGSQAAATPAARHAYGYQQEPVLPGGLPGLISQSIPGS